MIKAVLLVLSTVLIPSLKSYCQPGNEGTDTGIRDSSKGVREESWDNIVDRAIGLIDHDNQRALELLVQCELIATSSGDSACMITSQRRYWEILDKRSFPRQIFVLSITISL